MNKINKQLYFLVFIMAVLVNRVNTRFAAIIVGQKQFQMTSFEEVVMNIYNLTTIFVEDCEQACSDVTVHGGKVAYGPAMMDGLNEMIAFVKDPDGYQVELVERTEDG